MTASNELWNDFVDGTVGGEGGFAFFCVIHFAGLVEGRTLLQALESTVEDEASGDPFLTVETVCQALLYAGQERACELVKEGLALLESEPDDDARDHKDWRLTHEFTDLLSMENIEKLIDNAIQQHPDAFKIGEGNYLD